MIRERGRGCARYLEGAVLLAALLFSLFLAWSVPYSATDDWLWGMEEGLGWWLGGTLNGRYGGNFFAVIMCRSQVVKTLVMGLVIFGLPLTMALLAAAGKRKQILPLFLAGYAGLLLMPPVMWQETYGWVSGFGNYVIPTLLFLVWLLAVRRAAETRKKLKAWAGGLFLLSFFMGLFVEHLTVLFLGCSLVLVLYALWDRQLLLPFLACLAGSVLAVGAMFLNGVVAQLVDTGSALNGLRELTFSPEEGLWAAAGDIAGWYVGRLLPIAFLRGVHMALPMALITACAFWNSALRPLCLLGLVPVGCNILILRTEDFSHPQRVALSALCWLLPLLALLVQRDGREKKVRRVLLYLCAPLALLPLAVTTTLGQRLYFFSTAILVLSAVDEAAPLLTRGRMALCLTALAAVGLMGVWGWRSADVLACSQLRCELTQQAVEEGQDTLILPTDRYERVVWATRNPWNVEYADYFRRFYQVPDDVTLIFLPAGSFEVWPQVTEEQWEQRLEFAPSKDYTPSLP